MVRASASVISSGERCSCQKGTVTGQAVSASVSTHTNILALASTLTSVELSPPVPAVPPVTFYEQSISNVPCPKSVETLISQKTRIELVRPRGQTTASSIRKTAGQFPRIFLANCRGGRERRR